MIVRILLIFIPLTALASWFASENATLIFILSAISIAGAVFLILELDQPFGGTIRISSEPMTAALQQLNH